MYTVELENKQLGNRQLFAVTVFLCRKSDSIFPKLATFVNKITWKLATFFVEI